MYSVPIGKKNSNFCLSLVSNRSVLPSVTTALVLWCMRLSVSDGLWGSKSPPDTGESLVTL